MDDDELDLDYSQTHLDDFLKSQTSSTMMKGSNIQSGQLLNSFLSTYNKMKGSGTGLSSFQVTGDASLNNLGTRKNSSAAVPQEVIKENVEDEESRTTEQKDINEIDSDEELGRSEEGIDLNNVSVKTSVKSSQSAK